MCVYIIKLIDGGCGNREDAVCEASLVMLKSIISQTFTQEWTRYAIGVYRGNGEFLQILDLNNPINQASRKDFEIWINENFFARDYCNRGIFGNINCNDGIRWMSDQLAFRQNKDNLYTKLFQLAACDCSDSCENWSLIPETANIDRFIVRGPQSDIPCNSPYSPNYICRQLTDRNLFETCITSMVTEICTFR